MVDSTRLVQFRQTAPCARPAGASPNRRMGGALLPMGGVVDFPFTPKAVFRDATGAWYDPSSLWGAADHLPRRNLLGYTDFSSTTYWGVGVQPITITTGQTSFDATADFALITKTAGTLDAYLFSNGSTGLTKTASDTSIFTATFYLKKDGDGSQLPEFALYATGGTATGKFFQVNKVTGVATIRATAGSPVTNDITVDSYDQNFWKITLRLSDNGANTKLQLYFRVTTGTTPGSFASNTTGSIVIGRPMLASASTLDQSYQRVTDWTTELYAHAASKNVPWLRRNMSVQTDDMSSSTYWTLTATTATSGTLTATASTNIHTILQATAYSQNTVIGQSYRMECRAKAGTHGIIQLVFTSSGFSTACYANFDLVNGSTGTVGADATASISTIDADGYYLISITSAANAAGAAARFQAAMVSATTSARAQSWATAGTETVLLKNMSVTVGSTAVTYQPIGASWEAQFAANASAAGVALTMYQDSAGTTPVTGADSVVGMLGDISQGYTPGAELVDTANISTTWSQVVGSPTIEQDGTAVKITGAASGNIAQVPLNGSGGVISNLSTSSKYLITAQVKVSSGSSVSVQLSNAETTTQTVTSSDYTYVQFVSYPANTGIAFRVSGIDTSEVVWVNAISVKELPGYHAIQSGATGLKPTLRLNSNGYWWIQRDLTDDSLVTTFPNLGSNCVAYRAEELATVADTGITLNGALTVNTPATDYGRIYLSAPSAKDAQIRKWLDGKRGKSAATFGPELLTNGTFGSGTTGWTANSTTISVVSGRLNSIAGTIASTAQNGIPGTAGAYYMLTAEVQCVSGTVDIRINNFAASANLAFSEQIAAGTTRTLSVIARCDAQGVSVSLRHNSIGEAYWDNVSLREVLA